MRSPSPSVFEDTYRPDPSNRSRLVSGMGGGSGSLAGNKSRRPLIERLRSQPNEEIHVFPDFRTRMGRPIPSPPSWAFQAARFGRGRCAARRQGCAGGRRWTNPAIRPTTSRSSTARLAAELRGDAAYGVGAGSGLLTGPVLALATTFQGHFTSSTRTCWPVR